MHHYDDSFSTRPLSTLEDNVRRFRKFGTIITRIAKNDSGDIARIGKIERNSHDIVYIVFYPNGDYERFESGVQVEYRTGWTGPDLDQKVIGDDIAEILMGVADEMNGITTKKTVIKEPKKTKSKLTNAQRAARNARARERYREKKAAIASKKTASIH